MIMIIIIMHPKHNYKCTILYGVLLFSFNYGPSRTTTPLYNDRTGGAK